MVACACHGQCLIFFFVKLTNLRYLHCCARTQRCVQSCTNSVIVIDDILRPCTSSSVTLSSPLRSRCCARTQRCVQSCTNSVIVIDDILRSCIPSSASLPSSPSSSLSSSFWRFWSWPQPSLPCLDCVALCLVLCLRYVFEQTFFFSFYTCGDNVNIVTAFTQHLKVVCCPRRRRGRRRRFQHVLS